MYTLRLRHARHYREHVSRNGTVVWFDHLNRLYCFSHSFSGDYDRIRMRECTDAYEIGYEPNSLGMCDWDNPVVVVFHSVKFQIMRHNLIPAELADDFSLPVLTLLEDVITYLKANEVTDCNHEATHQKVRAFLMKEKFVVSWKDVALILQKLRRH